MSQFPSEKDLLQRRYNRRDQKVLLDALRRHIDTFAALPALYTLLTDTPALTQPAIAFLYDEVRERLQQALKIVPGDTSALACLALVEQRLGRLDAAAQWLARL